MRRESQACLRRVGGTHPNHSEEDASRGENRLCQRDSTGVLGKVYGVDANV